MPEGARAELAAAAEPTDPGPGEVLARTVRVGFCGTDREIVRGGIAIVPDGADRLVLGHEMVAVVESCGTGVEDLAPGDWVVPTVRRSCGRCEPCLAGRNDFCLTGEYLEHGITRLDGFARPRLTLAREHLVQVPASLGPLAVLAEPLSVVEKAIDEARWMRSRIPGIDGWTGEEPSSWGDGLRAIVAGAGTIGLLTTYALTARGFSVETIDIRDPDHLAARLVRDAGATYTQVAADDPAGAATSLDDADVVMEATGDPHLALELTKALSRGGVLVWIGAFEGERVVRMDVGRTLLDAILGHHVVVGTVNAAQEHFRRAIADLERMSAHEGFGDIVTAVLPVERFEQALWPDGVAIKQTVAFS